MSIRHLKTFLAVAKHGTFAAAVSSDKLGGMLNVGATPPVR
ncbi:MAG: LysR family transcriptional regulator [Betaproteobacteria bacterium]|nr:LysR family transcriptional regulator [Betaproteobacteria bacterium]